MGNKTHWKKARGTEFLGEWSVQGEDLILTVKKVEKKEVVDGQGNKSEKNVIYFEECPEGMVVTAKVVFEAIEKATGSPFLEDWVGKKIALYKEHGRWFGKEQYALRVRSEAPAEIFCEECGQLIKSAWGMSASKVAEGTTKKYGKKLCAECAMKAKEQTK